MKKTLMLCLVFVVLAACASPGAQEGALSPTEPLVATLAPTRTSPPTATAPQPTPTTPPSATPVPTVTPTPFVPRAVFKMAVHVPLSGDYAANGKDILRGAELATSQLSGPLQEMGYQVELVAYDDRNVTSVAIENAQEIVADADILCGVGNFISRLFNQVQEIYHKAGIPFISPSTTAAFVTASGYLEVNRLVGRNDRQGAADAQFARAQGFQRVYMVNSSSDYSKFNAYHFRNEAGRIGLNVIAAMETDSMENFGWLIERIQAANADLVYFTGYVDQGGSFFREARAAGYDGAFLGPDSMDDPSLMDLAGPLLSDGGGMYYTTMAAQASDYPQAEQFVADFQASYGSEPLVFAAQAYDAAGICLKAIEESAKARGGELPARTEVAQAIRALQAYPGITGTYTFNKNGDPDPARYFIFKVTVVAREDWGQNKLVTMLEASPSE